MTRNEYKGSGGLGRRNQVYRRNSRSRYSRYGRDNHLVRNIIIISASAVIALAVAGVLIWYFVFYQPTQTSQNDVSSTAPSVIESTQSTESTVSQQTAANVYETLYPDMYVPQVEKIGAAEGEKSVYLTFNNAPSAQTDKLLDVLEQQGVKATFFIYCNENTDAYLKESIKKIHDKGHTVGVLTNTYDYQTIYASVENYLADFAKVFDLITEATGEKPTVFRFAGGSVNGYNQATIKDIVKEMERRGFTYHDWSLDSGDSNQWATGQQIYDTTVNGILNSGKSVVLMDNNSSATLEQLPAIIQKAKENGYEFKAMDATTKPFTMTLPE